MFNRPWSGYAGSSDWQRRKEEIVVTSEDRLRELEEKYEGYKVYDNRGERIGKVDDLFIDETDREEYVGVKMGFFGRKSTLIPMDIVRVNEADRALEVSESKDHVKNAPSFDDDEDITHEYEERIRSHFRLQSPETSSTRGTYGGYSALGEAETTAAGTPATDEGTDRRTGEAREGAETRDTYSGDADEGSRRDPVEDRMRESAARSSETSSRDTGSRDVPEYGAETTESRGAHESGEAQTQRTPSTRQTEETETFEEGGRTKVRRRIIREEIVEEDPNDRSSY
jgi:sporulation protein YlmC with PRC-barrel domain